MNGFMMPRKGHRSGEAGGGVDKPNWNFVECENKKLLCDNAATEIINRVLISSYSRIDRSPLTRSWSKSHSNKVSVVLETDPIADRDRDLLKNTFLRRCINNDNCVSRCLPQISQHETFHSQLILQMWKPEMRNMWKTSFWAPRIAFPFILMFESSNNFVSLFDVLVWNQIFAFN